MSTLPQAWRAALAAVAGGQIAAFEALLASPDAPGETVFPPAPLRLRALELTPPEAVRAVILGQDPYHGAGQACGLAFGVPDGIAVPPSLRNIFKELASDLGVTRANGSLEGWARQGVLLLNDVLTVAEGRAGSHRGRGWEALTDAIVAAIAARPEPTVFIMWGNHARAKAARIPGLSAPRHLVIEAPHPSPLSARTGFFGSRPFSRANAFLTAAGRGAIDWSA